MISVKRPKKGQALVEFVLILPLLIVIGLAFFDISFLMFTRVSVDRAVFSALNEAAAAGEYNYSTKALLPVIQKRLIGVNLGPEQVVVEVVDDGQPSVRTVTVTARFSRKAVSLMYFTGKSDIVQTVSVSRMIPAELVKP